MNNSASSANSGRPAVATTASGSGATPFNAVEEVLPAGGFFTPTPSWTPNPVNPSPSSSSSLSRGRGRNPTRTPNHPRPSAPRRVPQQPKLSKTYQEGGQVLPNSRAELEAYGKAMEEYVKDLTSFNEAKPPRSHRGPKRSHHGPSGNGNNYFIQDNDPQRRERARSPSGSQLPSNQASPDKFRFESESELGSFQTK
jgi:hypothetical protein